MITRIYRIPPGSVCGPALDSADDPLRDRRSPYPDQASNRPGPAYRPATYSMENSNEARQNPYRGYRGSDPVGDPRLRGRY
jgi:hypothetical protein